MPDLLSGCYTEAGYGAGIYECRAYNWPGEENSPGQLSGCILTENPLSFVTDPGTSTLKSA